MSRTPYNWTPEKHQMAIVQNPARFKIIVWHRKAHKTTLAINELLRWANAIKGTYWYVAPLLNQAKKIVWQDPEMLPKYCPPEIWEKRNNSELFLTFPNGSILYVMGADNPESLRGPNPKGVIFDEFDDDKIEVWTSIVQPIMTANPKAWTWFMGTPKGRRHLFKMNAHALNKIEEAKRLGRESEWMTSILKASESGIISKEALLEVKNDPNTPEDFYKQEYNCEFVEGAGSFFKGLDFVLWKGDMPPENKKRYHVGMDWAKINDFTVFTPFDLTTFSVGKQERFNQIDYNLQKAKAEAYYLRYNKAKVWMDGTGVGTPIFDDLSTKISALESYIFTEASRTALLTNLKILIEERKIKLPNEDTLLNELRSFQYHLTDKGKVKIGVSEGLHDDCFVRGTMILTDKGQVPIENIKVGDLVVTREGLKPVVMTRNKVKSVITNLGLKGTPDHPILLSNGLEKPLSEVREYDSLHIWNQLKQRIEKLSYMEARGIIGIRTPKGNNCKCIIGDMTNGKVILSRYIDRFGKILMVRSPKDFWSIIKTITNLIIGLITYSFFLGVSIINTIWKTGSKLGSLFVRCVVRDSPIGISLLRNFVVPCVGEEREMVYNLQISGCPEYFANNILVHNCVMSLALAVWEIPKKPYDHLYNEERETLKQFDYFQGKRRKLYGRRK